jgi:hypothetical protein
MENQDFRSQFRRFLDAAAALTQARMKGSTQGKEAFEAAKAALLEHFESGRERRIATLTLASPFFPVSLIWRGWIEGDYKLKYPPRPELTPQQAMAEKGLRYLILLDEFKQYYPGQVLSVPLDGPPEAGALPDSQWCDYCGLCCSQFGGVAPMAPKDATYPAHWLDDLWIYQYWCPFLFEYHWTGRLFCSIHRIKPVWCDEFANQAICRKVKEGFEG